MYTELNYAALRFVSFFCFHALHRQQEFTAWYFLGLSPPGIFGVLLCRAQPLLSILGIIFDPVLWSTLLFRYFSI